MESIEIPDDFYIYEEDGYRWLCHRSCVFVSNDFTNYKNIEYEIISNEIITQLRNLCNIIDEIEEKTYFVDHKFNGLSYSVYNSKIGLYKDKHCDCYGRFADINDFIDYLAENYPECIRSNDIKIALKD
jgi:hypothetical protein